MSRTATKKEEVVVDTLRVDSPDRKMGITEFLRKHPQDAVTKKLLKTYYGSKIMTEAEWLKALEEFLNTRITQ